MAIKSEGEMASRSSKPPASIIWLVIADCWGAFTHNQNYIIYGKPLPATTGTNWQPTNLMLKSNLASAIRYVPVIRNEKIVSYKTAYFGKIHIGVARPAWVMLHLEPREIERVTPVQTLWTPHYHYVRCMSELFCYGAGEYVLRKTTGLVFRLLTDLVSISSLAYSRHLIPTLLQHFFNSHCSRSSQTSNWERRVQLLDTT